MIYLDNNATTQVAPQVFDAMRPFLVTAFGNPSSAYSFGNEARNAVADARQSVRALLGARHDGEIVFTSGGTESDNWAVLGALEANPSKRHVITTRIEHEAVRKLCENLEKQDYRITWLDVDDEGSLNLEDLRSALSPETAVVSIMLANNETGILFPVREIALVVKEHSDALFHVDGVNAVGKVAIDLKDTLIDLFSLSAHKFHGPKGIGALFIRDGVSLAPMLTGGGQENRKRPGTEAVHQIAGLGAAAKFVMDLSPMTRIAAMRDHLECEILNNIPNSYLNGTADPTKRLPNTANISFENTNGEMILHHLDAHGICVSTGSACNSSGRTASPVLQAMNVPYSRAMGSIRFSLGRFNGEGDISSVASIISEVVKHLRDVAG